MTVRSVCLAACVLLFGSAAHADVVTLVVEKREAFSSAGRPYEKLTGRFYGELDARHPLNAVITDIEYAPRNARGRVEYSATFTILKPVDMTGATGILFYQVPNRGRSGIEGGGYFADFRSQGHVLVASGWQADIAAGAGIETMVTPVARNPDGSSITGPVMSRIADAPAGSNTQAIIRGRVTGTATPASLDPAKATLTRRASETGSRVPLGADEWAFADCTATPFPGTAAPDKVCLKGGFDPASLYELTYLAKDPPVHGIGFAATRDLIAFLRHGSAGNPLAAAVRHTIAQGNSQSGNYLRSLVHLGFNQDEAGRRVFDGMNPNIAARQLAMNIRFSAPSGAAEMFEPGSEGILWWGDYADQARGRQAGGLLARCQATETCPRIVETFGSAEFYSLRASPNLVGTRADRDIPLPANVRRYYSPSTRHGGGPGGFTVDVPVDACCLLASNPNPSADTNRALMHALVDWVAKDAPPPPSRYPRLDRGDLVPPTQAALGFPLIPGVSLPDGVIVPFFEYDFGPGFKNADVSGVVSLQPPIVRQTLPMLVPRVDADGNELAGVRSVLLEAPLGTYTGWNPIARGVFKGSIQSLGGGFVPFAQTKAQRLASGDPRLSLEERYGSHDAYVARVKAAAARAVVERFLLPDDAARLVAQAEKSNVLR
ncbi:MAG: alpha/beta hydrolase domain-containing protein [Acidobacteriota bacterium]|nr:alpha/beta hydrolase domain-containing protein [Acidobacteriota bacterium]